MDGNLSFWQKDVELPRFGCLQGDMQTQVAIIGGGMAGLLTAYRLKKRGVKAAVLEAGRIAGGQTSGTTAKITSQHGMIYDALIKKLGSDGARQYARANEAAIGEYAGIIRRESIPCDFEEASAYLYSMVDDAPLRAEAEAARALSIDAAYVKDPGLPFSTAGAVRFAGQARFHPLKFIQGICQGLDIFEDTRVADVQGGTLTTNRGAIKAEKVIFATHYPFVNVPGWYFLRMHQERSYVLALKSSWLPDGLYYSADSDGLSLRTANGLLLLGGEGHRAGENTRGGRYDALMRRARALFPDCAEAARWSAQDCVTLDGVPYIGLYSPAAPDWYVATGFGKWGMTSSMVSAMILSAAICGDTEPDFAPVFSPQRFTLSNAAKNLATDTAQAFKGLTRQVFALPSSTLDALPKGHGGIVEVEGQKAGVYKDASGKCFIVDPRCPHLGCQVEWNPDEKSWDCPCHGSRFRFDGTLISGPAQEDLK